jgi:hypothetical protein
VTEIWDLLGHKRIGGTVTIEWLDPTVGLIRFLYPDPSEWPYRGVVTVHIEGTEYEFKGMVFRASDDAPSMAEHRAVKGYLKSLGYQGMARRLKNGKVVVKQYGNSAKTQTVEKQSMKVTVSFDVKDDQGSDFATITASYVGVPASGVAHMEGLLISGFLQPLVDVASAQAAPAA